jgi:multisubunit Na+/H+ antiporter MnhB subunit
MDENQTAENTNLFKMIQIVINIILSVLGAITVLMIILGGINFMTSQGDPGKTKKGRDTILYGIIGLVIALLAYAIVNFVLANVFAPATTATPS